MINAFVIWFISYLFKEFSSLYITSPLSTLSLVLLMGLVLVFPTLEKFCVSLLAMGDSVVSFLCSGMLQRNLGHLTPRYNKDTDY